MKLVFCTRKLGEGRSGLLRSLKISSEQNFPSYEARQKLPEREVVFSNLPPAILAPVKVGIAGDVCLMKGCNLTVQSRQRHLTSNPVSNIRESGGSASGKCNAAIIIG